MKKGPDVMDRPDSSQESWRRTFTAQERVRREVAELLHGTVQGRLFVAAHKLRDHAATVGSDHPETAKQLAAIASLLDGLGSDEISAIVRRLRPPAIGLSLVTALRSLAGEFQKRSKVAVEVRARDSALHDLIHGGLPEDVRLLLYRLVEQALSDQERIASSGTIVITLRRPSESVVTVSIQRDGRGPALGGRPRTPEPNGPGDSCLAIDGATVEVRNLPGGGVMMMASLAVERG